MALDNLPAFPDDMYDTAHDGAVPQPVTPRKPISPFSFTKHLTRTPVPVAVSCPPPPPAPEILELPVSTGPSLSKRYDDLMREFRDSLNKATRTP